ncbi:MAG: FAD-dependent oxidoreductase, partial [Dehalococcoidia bacterium]|nr:FAD-dependent oxidoreductase [Dehalococcoidia bacterium]
MRSHLWETCRIGRMEFKNRIVMPPMVTNYGTAEGEATGRSERHYEARASGGVGLIILEATYVHPDGRAFSNQLGLSDDRLIPGMERLARVIHQHGAKVAVQLHHGGRMASSAFTRKQPVAPSPLAGPGGDVPRELAVAEIRQIAGCFAEAASRAKRAGLDGVELHAAHGYLIDQFISRSSNKRQDEYGGELQNRARFLIEVIRSVREAVGKDFPVWCRINGRQYGLAGPTPLEDAQQIARMAQDATADAIHVSAGGPQAPVLLTTPTFVPAVIADLAEGIKRAVTVPVIAVGRIIPEAGEVIVRQGRADLVAIGKGLLADPDLPRKAESGRLEDINPCIVCFACLEDLRRPGIVGIRCRVNPALGNEEKAKIVPAQKRRKVLVVGGGPAGMQAAATAARRGHQVTLWEKRTRLGGQLAAAAIAPHKDRMGVLDTYLQAQLKGLGVRVDLGTEATAAMIQGLRPDVVVLATGVRQVVPDIPGLGKARLAQAIDVLEGKTEVGERVVVIGGELVG